MSVRLSRRLLLFLCFISLSCLTALPALAQEPRSDVAIGGQGVYFFTSSSSTTTTESSISGGGVASYRLRVRGHSSAELSYGYSRSTFYYYVNEQAVGGGNIFLNQQGSFHQFTAAYVYNFSPWHHLPKVHPFVLGGGGLALFRPISNTTNTVVGAATQGKGAILYGGGIDYPLFKAFSLRVQYRGLLIKAPDFWGAGLTAGSRMNIAAPSAQLVFHF
jgi:hypothetical protein